MTEKPFPKSNINIKILSQVLDAHALASRLYIYYKAWTKRAHLQIVPKRSTKNTANGKDKPGDSFDGIKRAFTLAHPISLLI